MASQTQTLTRPAHITCPICGNNRSPIAYASAKKVMVYIPKYHQLSKERMMAAYQHDQLNAFRVLLDYERVLACAQTTPRKVVGWAGRKEYHPLRRYLNDADPVKKGWYRWDIFPSACAALERFTHIPHTRGCPVFECFRIRPNGASFTLYTSLPIWLTKGGASDILGSLFDVERKERQAEKARAEKRMGRIVASKRSHPSGCLVLVLADLTRVVLASPAAGTLTKCNL